MAAAAAAYGVDVFIVMLSKLLLSLLLLLLLFSLIKGIKSPVFKFAEAATSVPPHGNYEDAFYFVNS